VLEPNQAAQTAEAPEARFGESQPGAAWVPGLPLFDAATVSPNRYRTELHQRPPEVLVQRDASSRPMSEDPAAARASTALVWISRIETTDLQRSDSHTKRM
jgi:hypothetical protein